MDGVRADFYNLDINGIWEYLIGTEFNSKRADEFEMKNIQKVNYNPDIQALNSMLGGA
jgi:hypothetical protein